MSRFWAAGSESDSESGEGDFSEDEDKKQTGKRFEGFESDSGML